MIYIGKDGQYGLRLRSQRQVLHDRKAQRRHELSLNYVTKYFYLTQKPRKTTEKLKEAGGMV